MKVVQFEDTLSEEDHRNFNLIYESLLIEGKAGNLTDLTLGMVSAEKISSLASGHAWKVEASHYQF